ncbi:MAG: energy transducer TonB, partial [Silvibacterium sp.]|nr:energy transducer TonB [Silvibacterium sp.]
DKLATASNNPTELFLRAAKVNGLNGNDLKPWRLKISYKLFDSLGNLTDHGTIEEQWASPHMRKLVITTAASTLTYVETEKGIYREGNLNQRLALLLLLESSFFRPMPLSEEALDHLNSAMRTRAMGTAQLPCFTLKGTAEIPEIFNDPAYCLEDKEPVLRIGSFADDSHQFIRNNIGKFQNRYVPMDITAGKGERPDLIAHLDMLKEVATVDPSDFRPGPNAVREIPARATMVLPEGMIDRLIRSNHLHPVSRPQPEYPAIAKAAHIHGAIEMKAIIGTDGCVHSLFVINGPPMLQQAALDAVWQWKFEPPLENGVPAQIVAIITFHL